ncbi:MAG: 16S rRNA (cytosine(1402)-N(4))-methyltransferase RsmH [Planctomycetaceae bacterium]
MAHVPVLVQEVMRFLEGAGVRLLADATVGGGGHARAFLEHFPEARVVGSDRDSGILETAGCELAPFADRVTLRHAAFSELEGFFGEAETPSPDAFLFDLGVNSLQLDEADRGFSFRVDGPLDMRMDRTRGRTAAELLRHIPEADLGNLLFELGGERSARRVAAAIVAERRRARIETTLQLASIVRRAVRGRSRIDAATRTFQALRMAVNDEAGELAQGLATAARRVRPGGRILVLSFHSGEDRIVKNFFRGEPSLVALTKKPLPCTPEEARRNPRARSAKLRVAERRREDA